MDHFRLTVLPIPNNQSFLPPENRVRPCKNLPFVGYGKEYFQKSIISSFRGGIK